MNPFVPDAYTYTSFEKRFDSDGKVWLQVQAHAALTKLTPYGIVANEFGWISQALPAAGKYIYVGVPVLAAISTAQVTAGFRPWLQIGGYLASMVTATITMEIGESLTVASGAIADGAADFTGAAGEFAVCAIEIGAGSATQTVMLVPERIITI